MTPPTAMISGWHDIFLPWQIKDYAAIQAAGRVASLTIGPWAHAAVEAWGESVRQALPLFRTYLFDQPAPPRVPVRIYVMGAEEWREYNSWPPLAASPTAFYLSAEVDCPPINPTLASPVVTLTTPRIQPPPYMVRGSAAFARTGDMAQIERRSDVLLFTAEPLATNLEVIGPVSAELFFRSSLEYTDFFLVLCDVDPDGRSTNVCDGYIRIRPHRPSASIDGTRHVHVEFWPTAYRYRQGHRMRVIVASGAHPRYARNLGSGEPLADAVSFHVAKQQILHDPDHPSRILLPIGG